MTYVIDRRLNSKGKSTVNRQRFLDRYRKHIRRAVSDAMSERSITDMERGENVSIPAGDVSEPVFQHGDGGQRTVVHPGNKEFHAGDRVERPRGGGGGGAGGKASNSGEGMDEFVFQISQEEFLEFMFEDLALPNLVKRQLKGNDSFKWVHAGYANDGVPAKLNVVRSFRAAKARRIALTGQPKRKLKLAEQALDEALERGASPEEIAALEEDIKHLRWRVNRVPFLDTFDLRYNLHLKHPQPTSKAVMFCLMDVSGSMDQHIKELAKRFFLLLYMFLKRNYERTEVVFIRHHTSAKEVDEEEFFYSRETGGTVVSSALKLMNEVIEARYPANEWNIYGAQASDGDNWNDDSPVCRDMLVQSLLPKVQYFTYVEITRRDHQALWHAYEEVAGQHPELFAQRQIMDAADIYPVFRDLFAKQVQEA